MRSKLSIYVVLALAVGCSSQTNIPTSPTPPAAPGTSETRRGDVTFELRAPSQVRAGEPVSFTLRLRNTSNAPVTIGLTGITPAVDFIIETAGAQPVWSLLHGVAIPMVLQFRTLGPNEILDLSGVWTQKTNDGAPVAPGSYRLKAAVATDHGDVTAGPQPLTVTR